jgi:hypothetical protein
MSFLWFQLLLRFSFLSAFIRVHLRLKVVRF